jgi:hypothetical protein
MFHHYSVSSSIWLLLTILVMDADRVETARRAGGRALQQSSWFKVRAPCSEHGWPWIRCFAELSAD